jgi:hypothetical protein
MAGGLFGKPFVINEKCIVFSLIIMALFLYKPNIKNNIHLGIILFVIFVVSYVAMAWYDYYFGCDILPLKSGSASITGLFKPKNKMEKQITHEEDKIDIKSKYMLIYMSHILFIVPLLIYIGIKKDKVNQATYPLLIVLALFTLMYHGIKMKSILS